MPNWCSNRVEVNAPSPQELQRFKDFVAGDKSVFDFQKIYPMPTVLMGIQTGSREIDGTAVRVWREVPVAAGTGDFGGDTKAVKIDPEELEQIKAEHGFTNWYDWCVAHWGTKWGASEPSLEELSDTDVTYTFDTAWGPAAGIYLKLLALFPDFGFTWFYDEPGMGLAGYLTEAEAEEMVEVTEMIAKALPISPETIQEVAKAEREVQRLLDGQTDPVSAFSLFMAEHEEHTLRQAANAVEKLLQETGRHSVDLDLAVEALDCLANYKGAE